MESFFRPSPFTLLLRSVVFLANGVVFSAGGQSVWTGSGDDSWATSGNWSLGLPSSTFGSPSAVTFSTNDVNGDVLTLDGTYYLNRLVVERVNYGVTEKNLAAPGIAGSKLVFQKLGLVLPTMDLALIENSEPGAGSITRDIAFGSDIEIADDLTLTRTGGGSVGATGRLARTIFYGVISGGGKLIINSSSTSNGARIWFNNHNTFTGDIEMERGYLFQNFADSLGTPDKTITFGAAGNVTWDLTSANINLANGATIPYDIVLPAATGRNVLINAGTAGRQLTFSGDITGSASHGLANRSLHLIAQANQQFVFQGQNMTFGGQVFARYGTEVVVASANAAGVAWENVKNILLGEEITTSVTTTTNNSSLVLRGDFTLDSPIQIAKRAAGSTGRDKIAIGQINHLSAPFQAVFNGGIQVLESDYRTLNLISESGGSATFHIAVSVAGAQGLLINDLVNGATSGGAFNYYESAPTGTVIFSGSSRLGAALTGTGTAGEVVVTRGALLVNTTSFFAAVEVQNGAQLGGLGAISGNVTVREGGRVQPGSGDPTPLFESAIGSLTIDGDLNITGSSSLELQVAGASFNIGETAMVDVPFVFSGVLDAVGNHDFLEVTGSLTVNSLDSILFSSVDYFQPSWGDAFNLLSFGSLQMGIFAASDVLDLPELASIDPSWAWNTDLFVSHGIVVVVPEPSRLVLIWLATFAVWFRRCRR